MMQASAPGKAILVGEHAVVYDHPALAVPLSDLRTTASIRPLSEESTHSMRIQAPDIRQSFWLHERPDNDALAFAVRLTLQELGASLDHASELQIRSQIPVASGLGSGASTTIAIMRAITRYLGGELSDMTISGLAFEVEKLHHGSPSGIDNSVIALEKPILFRKGGAPQPLAIQSPITLVLAHCGITSSTGEVVGALRQRWTVDPGPINEIFGRIGALVREAVIALDDADLLALGALMDENHRLLQALDVSHPELDRLCAVARSAGAYGAKLSGAGAGGFMLALVDADRSTLVAEVLRDSAAQHVYTTSVA